jgi:hypothetical protein
MAALSLPSIVFSGWAPWTERARLKGIDAPGVYVLAHFNTAPAENADPLTQEVIYVGETCDRTLRWRWRQFHRCAFESKERGHSGGVTYSRLFGGKGIERLHVACFPVGDLLDDELRPLFIRYVERKLLLDYAVKWGTAPRCNRK